MRSKPPMKNDCSYFEGKSKGKYRYNTENRYLAALWSTLSFIMNNIVIASSILLYIESQTKEVIDEHLIPKIQNNVICQFFPHVLDLLTKRWARK